MKITPALLVLLAGCATMTDTPPDPNVPDPTPTGRCDAAPAQGLIGKPGSSALVETARRSSGASIARMLRPGEMVTMEYRADRVNVTLDDRGSVTAIRCG
ncbi:MAG: I78 family peptidase inhibitor [Sphingomonas sp.]